MKHLYSCLLLFVFFLASQQLFSQSEIWGVTTLGGDGYGTLYSIPGGSTNLSSSYNLTGNSGTSPQHTRLIEATNGKLYGMTRTGGANGVGVIFEYNPANGAYVKKIDLSTATGSSPRGPLMQASNGKIYGLTELGGLNGVGTLFEYDISGNTYTKKVDLATSTGNGPYGALTQAGNGKLYGVTRQGGTNGFGTIFEYDITGNTYTMKVALTGTTGAAQGSQPYSTLVETGGNLYGLAAAGGTNGTGQGVLYQYDYTNNIYTKKVDLSTANGSSSQGSLILAANGKLYGMTFNGGANNQGAIFDYSVSSGTYTKLFDLSTANGSFPSGSLVQASNGKFYGMTRLGGASSGGALFEFDASGPTYTKKFDFVNSAAIGASPFGSLMQASNGKLYGLTSVGGFLGGGVLFEYDITGSTYTKKVDLGLANAGQPNGGLILATNGKFYGTSLIGGTDNLGTIYEFNKTNSTFTKKIDLTAANGSSPYGSLLQATNGKLYGLTSAGGTNGVGVLYEYDLSGAYTKLVDLSSGNGSNPFGALIQATNGKLYGLTRNGGANGVGALFEYDISGNTYTKKYDFSSGSGANPSGSLVQASNGKLYGVTQLGGTNNIGVLFEYDITGNTYTKKYDFTAAAGREPYGSLIQATNGFLYGLSRLGGANSLGVLFDYDITNNLYTKRVDLTSGGGSQPLGTLIQSASGLLYGVTQLGGTNGVGTIFEYDITNVTYTKKMDFATTNGSTPGYTKLLEVCTTPQAPGAITQSNFSVCVTSTVSQSYSIAPVSNATSYTWNIPAGASITSGSTTNNPAVNLSGVSAGVYTFGVRPVNVCGTGTISVATVTVNALPVITAAGGAICAGNNFTINPSGASTFTYSGGSAVVSPTTNTNYSVTGTSAQGCVSGAPAVVAVTVNALPIVTVASGSICTGNSYTMAPLGALSFTYSSGSAVVSPTTQTNYSVTGTDANGCISNPAVATVSVAALPVISVNSGTICSGKSFTMVPGGANTYTFSGGSAVVSPLANTNYSVTGTSLQGCVSGAPAVSAVTVIALPTVSVNNGAICSGASFTMVGSGASTYTYSSGSPVVSPAGNTSYSVTGTSAAGCVSSNTAVSNVTVNALPTISVNSGTMCAGTTFTIIPTGALSYTYSGGTNLVSPASNTNYAVTGTDANGCVSSNTAVSNVTVVALPIITVNSGTICSGKSFTMVPGGAATFTYSSGSAIVSPLVNSAYSVTGTSSVGCISAGPAVSNVTVIALPTVGVNSGAICAGLSFTMIGTGASTYTYSGGTNIVSPASSTSYSVTGTSSVGCVSSNTAISNVTVNALPIITVNSGSICNGSSFTMVPGGALTYSFSSGSAIVNPSSNTNYSVVGTDTNGCISAAPAVSSVTVNAIPVITVNSGTICSGKSFTMIPGGAASFTFSSGSAVVSPLSDTNYSVTGTSAQGCVSSGPAISGVTVIALPTVSLNTGTICSGQSFTLIGSGASTYTFSSGSSVVSPTNNTSYSVTGTSAAGCVSSNTAVSIVTVNPLPLITLNSGSVCAGGSHTFIPGGAASYTFINGGPVVTPTATGNYSITGTSSLGCVSSSITVANVLVVALPTVVVNSGSICAGRNFTMVPTGAFTYTFSSGFSVVTPTSTTSYSVTGTNSAGCISASPAIANVLVVQLPTVTALSGAICTGGTWTHVLTGATSFTYSSGGLVVTPATTTTYSISGSNAQGCVSASPAVVTITVNPLPTVTISGSSSVCAGGSLTLTAGGANTYNWNVGTGSVIVVTPAASTTYSVLGTSVLGCTAMVAKFITVNPLPTITVNNGAVCPGNSFTITPAGATTYSYSGGGSNIVTPSVTTSYTITGSSAAGCTSPVGAVATVSVVNILTVTVSGSTSICKGGTVNLTANGASTYSWNTGFVGNSISLSPTVTTSYTVIGASGTCQDSAQVNVTVNPLPQIQVSTSASSICAGESVTLTGVGAVSYTWSATPSTGTSIVVSPSVTTSYVVAGTDANGCQGSTTFNQEVVVCAGLDHQRAQTFEWLLYPNPNEGEFIIEIPVPVKIVILNALGQQVLLKDLAEGRHIIELNEQAKGVYFVQLKHGGKTNTIKLIKQ